MTVLASKEPDRPICGVSETRGCVYITADGSLYNILHVHTSPWQLAAAACLTSIYLAAVKLTGKDDIKGCNR